MKWCLCQKCGCWVWIIESCYAKKGSLLPNTNLITLLRLTISWSTCTMHQRATIHGCDINKYLPLQLWWVVLICLLQKWKLLRLKWRKFSYTPKQRHCQMYTCHTSQGWYRDIQPFLWDCLERLVVQNEWSSRWFSRDFCFEKDGTALEIFWYSPISIAESCKDSWQWCWNIPMLDS